MLFADIPNAGTAHGDDSTQRDVPKDRHRHVAERLSQRRKRPRADKEGDHSLDDAADRA